MGPGAVGIAAAAALSSKHRVLLAAPPGTREFTGDFTVPGISDNAVPLTVRPIDRIDGPSLVVAALKAYDIAAAVPWILGIHSGGILCLSNGLGLDREWGKLSKAVEYAVLTAGFRRISPLEVEYSAGEILCEKGGLAERLFFESGIEPVPQVDMEGARWAKWYVNSIINPAGALSGLPNNEIMKSPDAADMVERLAGELAALAPGPHALRRGREMLNRLLEESPNRCSMLQDLEAGRQTEIDFLTGKAAGASPAAGEVTALVKARSPRT